MQSTNRVYTDPQARRLRIIKDAADKLRATRAKQVRREIEDTLVLMQLKRDRELLGAVDKG
jgi:hypothetical protein